MLQMQRMCIDGHLFSDDLLKRMPIFTLWEMMERWNGTTYLLLK